MSVSTPNRPPGAPRAALDRSPHPVPVRRARLTVALAVALATVVLAARPARAELWASSMGDLLRTATRVELVTVDAVTPGNASGAGAGWSVRVTDPIRGRAVGTTDTLEPWSEFAGRVAPGSRLLVVCEAHMCPRAVGLEQPGGVFVVRAHEFGDGAWVLPPLVERGSIGALARGAPPPRPLCLVPTVDFVDTPALASPLRATISPVDGTGTLAGAAVPPGTRVRVGAGFSGGDADVLAFNARGGRGSVEFLGTGLAPAPGGCLAMRALPVHPLARTPAELAAAWTRTVTAGAAAAPRVLAAGVFVRRAGPLGPAASGPVAIELDADGSLQIAASALGVRGRVGVTEIRPGNTRLGVSLAGTAGGFPELLFELPRAPGAAAAQSAPLAVALSVQGGSATWRVLLRRRAGEELPVGEVQLRHPAAP